MAESLSAWLTSSVVRSCSAAYATCSSGEKSGSVLQDAPFGKGSKVQIIRFLGFGRNGAQAVGGGEPDDADSDEGGDRTGVTEDGGEGKMNSLWAVVGDRKSRVCVKFSRECVRQFDGGSIVGLRWYRPSVSLHAAHLYALENDASVTGPFASAAEIAPRLFLQVEDVFLWGSVNAPTFWESNDLQSQLLNAPSLEQTSASMQEGPSLFRKWFGRAVGESMRQRASKRKPKTDLSGTSTPMTSPGNDSERIQSTIVPSFQRPRPKRRVKEDEKSTVSDPALDGSVVQPLQGWGDFSLSWADDEFGLESAVGDAIQHKAGEKARDADDVVVEGKRFTEEHHSSDPFSLSAEENAQHDDLGRWRTEELMNIVEPERTFSAEDEGDMERESRTRKRRWSDSDSDVPTAEQSNQADRPLAKAARSHDANVADTSDGDWSTLLAYDDE